jgi:hypothetical protein
METRAVWQEIFQRFDPMAPPQRAEWRVDRKLGPTRRINSRLNRPFDTPRCLLAGTIGTGKTTELLRLAEQRAERDFAVVFDLDRHFRDVVGDAKALERVESWEICSVIALAAIRAAQEGLGEAWKGDSVPGLDAAWRALSPPPAPGGPAKLSVGELAGTLMLWASAAIDGGTTATTLTWLGQSAKALKWDRLIGVGSGGYSDQDARVQSLLDAVNQVLAEVHRTSGKPVLIVLDGLDRIRDVTRAGKLLVESELLAELKARLVVTAPFALRHHAALSEVRGFVPFILFNEPVVNGHRPSEHGECIDFFRDLFRQRTQDLNGEELLSVDLLDRLAYYSGGRARDFVKFVRELAGIAWDRDIRRTTRELIDEVLDSQRRLLESGVYKEHLAVLERVAANPHARLERNPLVDELLTTGRLLPYPNDSEWYYPHPLLTLKLLSPSG